METSRGGWGGVGWDGRTRDSSIPASAFVPHKVTRSKSLFPAARVGFPPKRQLGFEASPPRPLGPCLRAAAPSRPLFSDPSAPPRHPFPTPCASLSSIPGLLASNPGAPVNVPSLPPSGRPSPRLLRPVPPGTRDAFPSLPSHRPLPGCPPGAAPAPGRSPQRAAASQVLPAPPRSRVDTV